MNSDTITTFPLGVAAHVKVYVYRLIDPRSGETFYVGKGVGDRVFQHALGISADDEDLPSDKSDRIRDIRRAGLEVGHVIHRYGLDDTQAFEVEAALIDAYPGLTNLQRGHGSSERGLSHAVEIVRRYAAPDIEFRHETLMVNINRAEQPNEYEAARYAWKVSRRKAEAIEIVLAVERGLVVGVFRPVRWLDATAENFPGRVPIPGRLGFEGELAEPELAAIYRGRKVPDRFRSKGAANPIRYGSPSE